MADKFSDQFKGLPSGVLEKSPDAVSENERRTSADSSVSTWRARRADDASRWVGRGTEIVLSDFNRIEECASVILTYNEQGKATGSDDIKCSWATSEGSIKETFVKLIILGVIGGRWLHRAKRLPG